MYLSLTKKLLATHSTGSCIGYYLCLFMQIQFQLGNFIHVCTNKTHSLADIQYILNPYFCWFVLLIFCLGLSNACTICYRICFICACIDVTTHLELCLHEWTQIVANDTRRAGS